MRIAISFAVLLLPPRFSRDEESAERSAASAAALRSASRLTPVQDAKLQEAIEQKLAAIRFVQKLQDPTGGFSVAPHDPKVSLRATSAAVKALKYLHGKKVKDAVPNGDKVAAFVLSCYDPKTGGFADAPGGKPDVPHTAIGVIVARDLGIPKEKFAKAMDYLKEHAKSFEEVRVGAAAVEAWGVEDCPFDLEPWLKVGKAHFEMMPPDMKDGGAREVGSAAALMLRLQAPVRMQERMHFGNLLREGQRTDGGYGKKGEKASDIETTYRVARAFYLLEEKPGDAAGVRKFVASHRNKDGGSGVKPGEPSTVVGVYFATIIAQWLDELEN